MPAFIFANFGGIIADNHFIFCNFVCRKQKDKYGTRYNRSDKELFEVVINRTHLENNTQKVTIDRVLVF